MKTKLLFLTFFFVFLNLVFSQAPHAIIVPSNSAERIASFKVQDANTDFLEITNSTHYSNSFIPTIWGHQQSDSRYVMRLFATTKSNFDYGTIPVMVFRVGIRNSLNLTAPNGNGYFPWGQTGYDIQTRPLFAWKNNQTTLMTLSANGNFGIGSSAPTATLHTVGTVRFQNLPIKKTKYTLGIDANGNVYRKPIRIIKELKAKIKNLNMELTKQQKQINDLQKMMVSLQNKKLFTSQNEIGSYLKSNHPNPFERSTMIEFFVENEIEEAKILLFDTNGSKISIYPIKERGEKSTIIIPKNNLKSGIYFYTLITDGNRVDTKKMIVK